ncbi:MAG: TrbC/VirB2 family protein [Alphaproteobacteria bacterium]|nr:TrbC/VirB2 family protein [Alphaproteobacteria bacterium]
MQFLKKNIWTLSCMVLFAVMAMAGDAAAVDGNSLMETAQTKAKSVFVSVKTIIFIVGGFGLVGLAFSAVFGKMKWTWFASLAVGLAILAAAGAIVEYATGDRRPNLETTFGDI